MGPNADQPKSPEAKPGSKLDAKEALKSLPIWPNAVVEPVEVTPQIARRAYELYEQRGRRDGQAGQDWLEAEREIRDESPK